ncbi:glycosyltransferase [Urechidicola croceus]|uniref:Glycosyl transferase group 1 n=1 Tax=Urechidicola croceus TaxID=1850246 RepID=A0A1D8PAY3_9FLAO|nr:glycosyltransferase [Urechidicola croceus]AOW21738.1 glycosyl transferase group 1 [Urechidicola croceus]
MPANSKKVFVAVTNDISSDQRVHKVCEYLTKKGFEVEVYGRVLSDTFEVERSYKITRKKLWFNNNFLFYAEYNVKLLFYLFFRKYKYILSNDLDTLPACFIASKLKKTELIYDSHEYFTEVPELQGRKFVQKFWLKIEGFFLPKVKNAITVSQPIADAYKKKYKVNFEILRNLPSLDREVHYEEVSFPTNNKVVLYQGILNPGRGIKPMIDALNFLENIDLVIIGYGKVKNELIEYVKKIGLTDRVHFLGRIPHEKLPNYTKIADVGMVMEEPLGKSFEYSLPNKLFDFIHEGIPIISSPLVEVKKIVEKYNVGLVIKNYEPTHIAEIIRTLVSDKELRKTIILNQKSVKKHLSWENDVKLLDKFFI